MATFLSLVNDVARESGTISQSQELATVVGANGRLRKIVNWTRQAWEMIQRSRDDWTFQRQQGTATLTIGQTAYSGADLGATDFGRWLRPAEMLPQFTIYDSTLGRGDETRMYGASYRAWLEAYDIGSPDQMRPLHYAIGHDKRVHIGPPPDKAYSLRFWYRRNIQSLAADADVPYIDEAYHQAIVWRALMLLGDDDESAFEASTSTSEFNEIYAAMVNEYLDEVQVDAGWP